MKVTIKTDDGKSYTGTMIEETKPEPRIGTLCMFWDDNADNKRGPYLLIDAFNSSKHQHPYISSSRTGWKHCEEINDPTCIIKSIAPPDAVCAYISSIGNVTFVDMHSIYCRAPGRDGAIRDDAITWLTLRQEQFGAWFGKNIKL